MMNGVFIYFIELGNDYFIFLMDEFMGFFYLVIEFDYENVLCYCLIVSVRDKGVLFCRVEVFVIVIIVIDDENDNMFWFNFEVYIVVVFENIIFGIYVCLVYVDDKDFYLN